MKQETLSKIVHVIYITFIVAAALSIIYKASSCGTDPVCWNRSLLEK